jgi:hypothetical protein
VPNYCVKLRAVIYLVGKVFVGTANNIYLGMRGINMARKKKQEATNIKIMQNREEEKNTNAL